MTPYQSWIEAGISKAFFINLDKREDRLIRIKADLADLGLEAIRHSAHDASQPLPVLSDYPILNSRAQLACVYSHLSLWRELLCSRPDEIFLILEDDCTLAPRLPCSFSMSTLPAQWEILQLGSSFPGGLKRNLRFYQRGLVAVRWEPPGWGTFAYLAKRSFMRRMVRQHLPIGCLLNLVGYHRPERIATDALLYFDSKSYSSCLPLATTNPISSTSDIGYNAQVDALNKAAEEFTINLWRIQGLMPENPNTESQVLSGVC